MSSRQLWVAGSKQKATRIMDRRQFLQGTLVCAAAQTGTFTVNNETRATYGHSLVADPWGHVVAKASDGVGIVSARLDPARVKRVRGLIPVADHKVRIVGQG